jgi:flagellar biosynthesis protein FlhF
MTQHKVIAEDSLSAMDEISRVLGKDAVILKTEKINGKIHILGSNNIEDLATSNAKKINKNKSNFSHLFSNKNLNQKTESRKIQSVIEKNNIKNDNPFAYIENETNSLPSKQFVDIETFKNFTNKIENLLGNMILADMDTLNSYDSKSLTLRLLKKGYSKKIISEFQKDIAIEENIDPELTFYHYLSKKLVLSYEDTILNSDLIFINGPSGSGKTTLCSKIASYILDNKFVGNDRHKLSIVNFAPKSSNHSELINFGRLLNLNVNSISSIEDLVIFIDANRGHRKLIIDVSQENNNSEQYHEYINKITLDNKCSNVIALQASTNRNMIKSIIKSYKNSFPTIALTKLDEANIGSEELSILGELCCKVGILSGSKSIIGSLAFAKSEVLAQYMKDISI